MTQMKKAIGAIVLTLCLGFFLAPSEAHAWRHCDTDGDGINDTTVPQEECVGGPGDPGDPVDPGDCDVQEHDLTGNIYTEAGQCTNANFGATCPAGWTCSYQTTMDTPMVCRWTTTACPPPEPPPPPPPSMCDDPVSLGIHRDIDDGEYTTPNYCSTASAQLRIQELIHGVPSDGIPGLCPPGAFCYHEVIDDPGARELQFCSVEVFSCGGDEPTCPMKWVQTHHEPVEDANNKPVSLWNCNFPGSAPAVVGASCTHKNELCIHETKSFTKEYECREEPSCTPEPPQSCNGKWKKVQETSYHPDMAPGWNFTDMWTCDQGSTSAVAGGTCMKGGEECEVTYKYSTASFVCEVEDEDCDECGQTCTATPESRTRACPTGQVGEIKENRTMNLNGVCGASSAWALQSNTCATPPVEPDDGITLFGEDAYNCHRDGTTNNVRVGGVCDSRGSTPYVVAMRGDPNYYVGGGNDAGRIRVVAGTMKNTGIANPDWTQFGGQRSYNTMSRACARKGYKYFQGFVTKGNDWDDAVYRYYNMPAGNSGTTRTANYTNLSQWQEVDDHKGCTGCETAAEVYCTNSPTYNSCAAKEMPVNGWSYTHERVLLGSDNLPEAPFGKRVQSTVDIPQYCDGGEEFIKRNVYTCRPGGWVVSGTVGGGTCGDGMYK